MPRVALNKQRSIMSNVALDIQHVPTTPRCCHVASVSDSMAIGIQINAAKHTTMVLLLPSTNFCPGMLYAFVKHVYAEGFWFCRVLACICRSRGGYALRTSVGIIFCHGFTALCQGFGALSILPEIFSGSVACGTIPWFPATLFRDCWRCKSLASAWLRRGDLGCHGMVHQGDRPSSTPKGSVWLVVEHSGWHMHWSTPGSLLLVYFRWILIESEMRVQVKLKSWLVHDVSFFSFFFMDLQPFDIETCMVKNRYLVHVFLFWNMNAVVWIFI
jgi:hypothetical protein